MRGVLLQNLPISLSQICLPKQQLRVKYVINIISKIVMFIIINIAYIYIYIYLGNTYFKLNIVKITIF